MCGLLTCYRRIVHQPQGLGKQIRLNTIYNIYNGTVFYHTLMSEGGGGISRSQFLPYPPPRVTKPFIFRRLFPGRLGTARSPIPTAFSGFPTNVSRPKRGRSSRILNRFNQEKISVFSPRGGQRPLAAGGRQIRRGAANLP